MERYIQASFRVGSDLGIPFWAESVLLEMVMGDSLALDFYGHWISDLAMAHGAAIISPNYRLMPEATSTEINDDIRDFWEWLHSSALVDLLSAHTTPTTLDLDRILTTGESAGGLLSINLALSNPSDIRATTAAYPFLDIESEDYSSPRAAPPVGMHVPESVVQDTMSSIALGTAVSSILAQERAAFMPAATEHGALAGMYERGVQESERGRLYPMDRLEQPDCCVPRRGIAIIQGRQDSVVPVRGVEKFVNRAREVLNGKPGSDRIVLALRDGEHGFDGDVRLAEQCLQDALKVALEAWLE
ncbi:hypothetical protein PENVUL_c006G06916 [Penicillium vulpinum]|uniref:Alpha/beta hydrolase fold-3 domain-containing protein n=1 Tax=Penicillium vulpinum TaxID=29845 RepID=A0A1V6S685_9EURO|nr:hypothetical protein PENVUL_c006G06916 [Penicillium vulpinum]